MLKKGSKAVIYVLISALILTIAAGLYLYLLRPFIFQELASSLESLRDPEFLPVNPEIDTWEEFDAFTEAQLQQQQVSGAAVAVVAGGKIVWSKGYGFANRENQIPATGDTPFMIGSISKAVMGVALMHAVENGALELDRDINDYLPFQVNNPRDQENSVLTLRHLATHTSGIRDRERVYAGSYEIGDPTVSLDAFLRDYLIEDGAYFKADGNFLPVAPGETYEYSNIGAGLAGYVLQAATGTDLDQYAQEAIFSPLGMDHTGWFLRDFADQTEIAQPYAFGNRAFPHYGYPTWPDGQLRTSANDLARLLAMVMNGGELEGVRILDEATVEQMLEKQSFPGLESGHGQGIFWTYSSQGMAGHNGGDLGVTTVMYFNPATQVGVVVLSNANSARAVGPVFNIARQMLQSEGMVEIAQAE